MRGQSGTGDGGAGFDQLTQQPLGLVRCPKCGVEAWFETRADAREASWGVAPYFTLQPLCPNCLFGAWAKEFLFS